MEGAKSSIASYELPTGVLIDGVVHQKITFREISGIEEDILASKAPASEKLSKMMGNCLVSVGEISDRNKLDKLINKMITTDRWMYLVHLRIHSVGAAYQFKVECPECKSVDKVSFDLNNVKVINPPKADSLYKDIVLNNGMECRVVVSNGDTDSKIEKMSNDSNVATIALYARISELNKQPPQLADVKQLSMKDRNLIRKAIDELEGEFDDEFDTTCPKCAHQYKSQLALDGQSFFFQ